MTFSRMFIAVAAAAVFASQTDAFVLTQSQRQNTELSLKSTVPERFSFRKGSSKTENAEYDLNEDKFHRRIVRFHAEKAGDSGHDRVKDAKKGIQGIRKEKEGAKEPGHKIGWNHRTLFESLDP